MTLYLLRHGKTEANEKRLYCGFTDLPLSEAGKAELSALSYPRVTRCITSSLRRTEETAKILFPGAVLSQNPDLREMNFGDFEMKSYEMLKNDPAYIAWITGDNEKNVCPGGESGFAATKRAIAALQGILSQPENDTAIITHGGIIAGVLDQWFPGSGKNRYEWQPKPGHGYRITVEKGVPTDYEAI